MSMYDLAPCPFCGCPHIWAIEYVRGLNSRLLYSVQCPACRARGSEAASKTEAILKWNAGCASAAHAIHAGNQQGAI